MIIPGQDTRSDVIYDRFQHILQENLFCYDLLDGKVMQMRTPYGIDVSYFLHLQDKKKQLNFMCKKFYRNDKNAYGIFFAFLRWQIHSCFGA